MKHKFLFLIILISSFVFFGRVVYAADIFVTVDKNNVVENQTFSVSLYTNTKGVSINNIEGVLSFPKDYLGVDSVSSNGSIFSLWVEQPTFSNTNGSVSFNGGLPTPGYFGAKGKIISVVFRAKKAGTASIFFPSANIYADDGLGTDVLSNKNGTTVTISPYQVPTTTKEAVVVDKLPILPVISSIQMSNSETWYSLNQAKFSWNLPVDVTSVQVLLGSFPDSIPTVTYTPAIDEKLINDLSDGVRYLHVRFKNNSGWGKTAHRKIKIDNTSPVNLNFTNSITADDLISLKISSEDKTSGLSKYKISIDGVSVLENLIKDNPTEIILPAVKSGNHEVAVFAYDKAGNVTEKTETISFPIIKAPEITKHSNTIQKGDKIEVQGTSYANTDVRIWLQTEGNDPKSYVVKTLADKTFSFTSDYIDSVGLASIWAEAMRGGDVIGPSSPKYFTTVNQPQFIKKSIETIQILSLAIPILLVFMFLMYLALHGYHRLSRVRRRLMTDLVETENEAHKIFKILAEDSKQILKIFKNKDIKNKISEDDNQTINNLSKDIKEAEEYFTKRIKNIEKKDLK